MLGLKIGNYKVTSIIGEGGMGAVYRAVHETLGRSAAVKVLLPEISNSREMVARFFNEARSAASIQHPGIVEAYDFGFLPDGRAYLIMEFLEGESLGSRLRHVRRLPHASALQIIRSVARALHAAHERGIVHRDIKPDNIFLVPDPEVPTGERTKLLDFGIAKLGTDGVDGAATSLTRTGAVMGTPKYMAPEQCRGAGSVDRRADLYALGCILYELICGQPPFIAEGVGDIIAHHLYFQPHSPRSHDASITPALEALVMALLQKDPSHRPPTALAVAEEIDRLGVPAVAAPMPLGELPPPVDPPSTTLSSVATPLGGIAGSPSRRRFKLLAAVAIAAAALVVVAVVATVDDRGSGDGLAAVSRTDAPLQIPLDTGGVVELDAALASPPSSDASSTAPALDAPEELPVEPPARLEKSTPPISPPLPPKVSPTCTKNSFASVLQAKQPAAETVQAALIRLRRCQKELAATVYAELQQQLISKL